MCNTCLSSNLSCQENFGKNGKGKDFKDGRSNSWNILSPLLQLQPEWMTCFLRAALSPAVQIVSKKLNLKHRSLTRGRQRIFRHPLAAGCTVAFLVLFYAGLPLCFYLCPWVRRSAVFMNFVDWPFQDLSSPESYGLRNTRHFFVETSPGTTLGVWHVFPRGVAAPVGVPPFSTDDRPVVLYLHGSAESRSAAYRRSMYRVLTDPPINAHVITFDYRGFGDSTYLSPSVRTVEEDATAMFHWLKQQVPTTRIILWGHSMGSGIAVRIGASLKNDSNPSAIVLEAPFTSVADATHTFPLSFFHRRMPFFGTFCSERTRLPDTHMDSEALAGRITAPLLIFHAADDSMVWSTQGRKVWERAVAGRDPRLHRPVFVELDQRYGCGHRNIHRAPEVPREVVKFLASAKRHTTQLNT